MFKILATHHANTLIVGIASILQDPISLELLDHSAVVLKNCGHTFNEEDAKRFERCPLDRQVVEGYMPNILVRQILDAMGTSAGLVELKPVPERQFDGPTADRIDALLEAGVRAFDSQNYKEAVQVYTELMRFWPENVEFGYNRVCANSHLGIDDFEGIRHALRYDSDNRSRYLEIFSSMRRRALGEKA